MCSTRSPTLWPPSGLRTFPTKRACSSPRTASLLPDTTASRTCTTTTTRTASPLSARSTRVNSRKQSQLSVPWPSSRVWIREPRRSLLARNSTRFTRMPSREDLCVVSSWWFVYWPFSIPQCHLHCDRRTWFCQVFRYHRGGRSLGGLELQGVNVRPVLPATCWKQRPYCVSAVSSVASVYCTNA